MPCDTIQTIGVQLKVADMDLLEAALKSLYKFHVWRTGDQIDFGAYGESFNKATHELRVKNEKTAALIKQAYSAEIVKAQAKKYNWLLKETAPYTYEITKR